MYTLYHNPKCGTSRNVLALLREAGIEPLIVEYLKTPLTGAELAALAARLGGASALVRTKEPGAAALRDADDATIIAAIAAEPILFNRPVVVTDQAALVCRPSETVRELL